MWLVILLQFMCINFQYTYGLANSQGVRSKRETNYPITYPFEFPVNNCTTIEGEAGRCIPIKECDTLIDLLVANKNDPDVRDRLKKSHCGFTQKYPKVCCKINHIYDHFPSECGNSFISTDRRIIGRAPKNAWPWIVLLGREYNATTYRWKCLGALVTEKHVVTSADCIATYDRPTHARLGEYEIKSNTYGEYVEREIHRYLRHPEFNSEKRVNDIGIVELVTPVTFSASVKPICLPYSEKLMNKNFTGAKSYIAGWGRIDEHSLQNQPTYQQEATVLVRSTEECNAAYSNFSDQVTIDDHVICAGGGKNDACQGDGGGPLMVEEDGLIYMLGTVSYGYKCGIVGYPGVYSRVPSHMEWIASNTIL